MERAQKSESIKRNREELRNNLKSKLKLPFIKKQSLPSSPMQIPPDPKVDRRLFESVFELLERLGQGAHGVVYKCRERKTDKIYAVKVAGGDQELITLSKKTFKILKFIDDSRVIKARCLFIDERKQQIFLVMEYCPYPSLRNLLKQKCLSYQESKTIIKKLLETVKIVNESLVCHRDLKPENILYDRKTEQIKLIDFGVSKLLYNRRKTQKFDMWTMTGTIQYKAPEMFEGVTYDQKVDAWAVGIISYELIYGRPPFSNEYLVELIERIQKSEPEYPDLHDKQESSMTSDFIKALLKKNPDQRVSCKQALKHPFIEKFNRSRLPSEDFCSSMVVTPLRDVPILGAHFTHSPQLAQSSLLVPKSPVQEHKLSWSSLALDSEDVIEVRKDVRQHEWKLCADMSENIFSQQEIEKDIDLNHIDIFDIRDRKNSVPGDNTF